MRSIGGSESGTPAAFAAGVQRREIEGEGLGGFARRHPINVMRARRFLAFLLNF
jgi:hypothetical protein